MLSATKIQGTVPLYVRLPVDIMQKLADSVRNTEEWPKPTKTVVVERALRAHLGAEHPVAPARKTRAKSKAKSKRKGR